MGLAAPRSQGKAKCPSQTRPGSPCPSGDFQSRSAVGIKAQTCQAQGAAEGPEDLSVALSCPVSPCGVALGKSLHLPEPINEYPDAADPYGPMVEVEGSSAWHTRAQVFNWG